MLNTGGGVRISNHLPQVIDAGSIAEHAAQGPQVPHAAVLIEKGARPDAGGGGAADDLPQVVDGVSNAVITGQGAQVAHDAVVIEKGVPGQLVDGGDTHDLSQIIDVVGFAGSPHRVPRSLRRSAS